jgi:hypothetical protein
MAVTVKTAENFSIDQGADFSRTLTVTTDGTTAYDISGLTLQAQMRKSFASTSATTFTCTIVSGTAGLTDVVTAALDGDTRYVYDVELILADSTIEKVHHGIITVNAEATKV